MQEHLRAWLGDPQGRDQYATYRGDEVEIHWHGKPSQCEVAYSKVVSPLSVVSVSPACCANHPTSLPSFLSLPSV